MKGSKSVMPLRILPTVVAPLAMVILLCARSAAASPPGAKMGPGSQIPKKQFFQRNISYPTPIQHVVVIVQENRTPDNLFYDFPGANVCPTPITGTCATLTSVPLVTNYDISHTHAQFYSDYNASWPSNSYGYVQSSDSKKYFELAEKWIFADNVFQTNQGPSFPAHQYLIAGQSGALVPGKSNLFLNVAENPDGSVSTNGCGQSAYTAYYIDMLTPFPGTETGPAPPCLDYQTILDGVDTVFGGGAGNWRYYSPQQKMFWNAPLGVAHLYNALQSFPYSTDFDVDPTGANFQADVNPPNNFLAPLTYVVPCASWSDHALLDDNSPKADETGPNWVNFIVNTIGKSSFWSSTTIIVTWDDWGGWYDHLQPTIANPNPYGNASDPYEYGFRTPMIVISPYLNAPGTVDHVQHTQASILSYIESVFGVPSLGTTDQYSDNLSEMFNYSKGPANFSATDSTAAFPASSCPTPPTDNEGAGGD